MKKIFKSILSVQSKRQWMTKLDSADRLLGSNPSFIIYYLTVNKFLKLPRPSFSYLKMGAKTAKHKLFDRAVAKIKWYNKCRVFHRYLPTVGYLSHWNMLYISQKYGFTKLEANISMKNFTEYRSNLNAVLVLWRATSCSLVIHLCRELSAASGQMLHFCVWQWLVLVSYFHHAELGLCPVPCVSTIRVAEDVAAHSPSEGSVEWWSKRRVTQTLLLTRCVLLVRYFPSLSFHFLICQVMC